MLDHLILLFIAILIQLIYFKFFGPSYIWNHFEEFLIITNIFVINRAKIFWIILNNFVPLKALDCHLLELKGILEKGLK